MMGLGTIDPLSNRYQPGSLETFTACVPRPHRSSKDPEAYATMIPMGIDLNGRINRDSVRESLEIYRDGGMIPTAGEIDLRWIDESLLEEALRIVGPVQ